VGYRLDRVCGSCTLGLELDANPGMVRGTTEGLIRIACIIYRLHRRLGIFPWSLEVASMGDTNGVSINARSDGRDKRSEVYNTARRGITIHIICHFVHSCLARLQRGELRDEPQMQSTY
jgi:hypothetical protein